MLWQDGFYASYGYDNTGNMTFVGESAGTIAAIGYDGSHVIAEYDASHALTKRYVWGPGADEPLIEYDAGGNRTWLVADERGSIVARADPGGTAVAINRYDEYGIPQSTNTGRFQYTGQAWLPELGLYHYKARMYSPTLGRFMQTDPTGYGDGLNWYNYTGSDPVNFTDPSGLAAETCVDGTHFTDAQTRQATSDLCADHGGGATIEVGGGSGGGGIISIGGGGGGPVGPGIGGGGGGAIAPQPNPKPRSAPCPGGPTLNLGTGASATGFLGLLGLSGGGGVTASVPTASLPIVGDGSLRGTQITGSLSVTALIGLGVFLGAGPNYSLGGSSSSTRKGFSGSITPVFQGGAGDGAGAEVGGDLTSPTTISGAGGRIAGGVYAAVGARFQGNLSTGPIGCE